MNPELILGSNSPRRKNYLQQLQFDFSVQSADIDESVLANELAEPYVARMALTKAQVLVEKIKPNNQVILTADTSVVSDHHILGKPENFEDFSRMMQLLSANTHQVLTAICVTDGKRYAQQTVSADVGFKTLTEQEINAYWHTNEPQDKAGGYGIQGYAGQFVTNISGSYSAIVGLPLYQTAQLLAEFNVLPRIMR